MKTKTWKLLSMLTVVALALCCALVFASCESEELETEIVSAQIQKNKTTVKLEITLDKAYVENHSGEKLYVVALPYADAPLSVADVLGEIKVKDKQSFKLDLYDGNGFSRMSSAFAVAESSGNSYVTITEPQYVSNPEALASVSVAPQSVSGIKGMELSDSYGQEFLGASHALVEVEIDELMLTGYQKNAIKFNYEGISYFFDGEKIEALDEKISEATGLGQRVYMRTVLSHPEILENGEYEKTPIDALYCDGIKAGKYGYLVNVDDAEARGYLRAFYAFLATRYSGEYGTVANYIIGNLVNDSVSYCNAGKTDAERISVMYDAWVRMAYNTLRSVNSSACVYVSVSNEWITDTASSVVGSKAFLSRFASNSKASGNYDWGVSIDLGVAEDMSYLLSGEGYDYTTLGVTNLSELSHLMESADMRYASEKRSYMIDGLYLPPKTDEKNRAAYYTYAYYQAASLGFDALIYSGDSSEALCNKDGERSDLYYAFLMCGSNLCDQLSTYTAKIQGQTIPAFADYTTANVKYDQTALFEISEAVAKNKKPFPISLDKFTVGGGAYNASMKAVRRADGTVARSLFVEADTTDGFSAISCQGVPAKDIVSAGYIGITMSSKTSPTIALMISDRASGTSSTYIGEAKTVNGEATYYFDVSDFNKKINTSSTLDVSICILPDSEGDYASIEISEISMYGSSGNGTDTVIVVIVVAAVVLICGLLIFLMVRRRKKKMDYTSEDA
jgi:hypothetical protein